MARARGWCFTCFNVNAESIQLLEKTDATYLIAGKEICPKTQKEHLQGYVYWRERKRFNGVKEILPDGCHIEVAKGSPQQNHKYCSKEGNVVVETGELPIQGKRKDIDNVREVIDDGGNMRDVCAMATGFQSIKIGEKLLQYTEKTRDWKPNVQWFWGPTGTGKTREARRLLPDAWWSGKNLKWWQGYDAHEDVIIDDFRGDFCTFHELLRILDQYPYTVEVKGGSRQLLAKNIIITSCWPPHLVYNQTREHLAQLERRIDEIREFHAPE